MFKPHHLPESPESPATDHTSARTSAAVPSKGSSAILSLDRQETIIWLKFGSTKSPDLIYPIGKININQHVWTPQSHLVDQVMSSLFHWLQHTFSQSPSVSTNRPRGRVGAPETTSSRGMWSMHSIAMWSRHAAYISYAFAWKYNYPESGTPQFIVVHPPYKNCNFGLYCITLYTLW